MAKRKVTRVWVVTIDGHYVSGTATLTRKMAYQEFIQKDDPVTWKKYQEAGYRIVKAELRLP